MIDASLSFTAANVNLVKRPIHRIEIQGYSRVFLKVPSVAGRKLYTPQAGEYDWIISQGIDTVTTTIADMDGGANISDLVFRVQDNDNAITADLAGFVFEGKEIVLKSGFVGMAFSDFVPLFTGLISTVTSTNKNKEYEFDCVALGQELSRVVYQTADDGAPTDSDHVRTLNGHPLDLLISLLENELGIPPARIDIAGIQTYRDGIYSGTQFQFRLTSPPAAKEFIEAELLKPLGAYYWHNNQGVFKVNFFYPQTKTPAMTLTRDNLTSIPLAEQADMVNQVLFKFDFTDDGKPLANSLNNYELSQVKYGLYGEQVIESNGMRSAFQGFFLSALTARLIFLRYGQKTLQFGENNDLEALWTACILEPGDQVLITHPQVPDRVAGVMGITEHVFEVMDRAYDFNSARVGLKLLDLTGSTFKTYYISPSCEPDFTVASDNDKAHYLFQSNDSDQYSDSTPANTLA